MAPQWTMMGVLLTITRKSVDGGDCMAQAGMQVQLSIKEINEMLCPQCKAVLRELIKSKISDQMIDSVVGR